MGKERLDSLRVIRREYASEAGCSEVCRAPDGRFWVRLCIRNTTCQKAYLASGTDAPARLDQGALEVLLPCRDGERLAAWAARSPTLGQRRDACLALVAQCVAEPVPSCVVALAARKGNLRFGPKSAWLQPLPDWGDWRSGVGLDDAVNAVARLCRYILTEGAQRDWRYREPPELKLFYIRLDSGAYRSWSQLQQDLSALPDAPMPWLDTVRATAGQLATQGEKWIHRAAMVLVAVLVGAALLSLARAYQVWRAGQAGPPWPGVTQIGDQRLSEE